MSRDSLQAVVGLRQLEERRRRTELARRMVEGELARARLGPPPQDEVVREGLPVESFLAGRARLHAAWAVYGACLERLGRAMSAEAAAKTAWSAAAADLRSSERLLERREHRARVSAARQAQKDLDEVAVVGWRRRRA